MTPEEEYLESLWAEAEGEDERPVLFESQVIQQASERPTYREFAKNHQLISTVNNGTGHGTGRRGGNGNSLSPLKATTDNPQQQLDNVIQTIESKRGVHEKCMLGLRKAGELVKSMEAELSSLEAEQHELETKTPPVPDRLRKVQQWVAEKTLALQVQQELVEAKQLELISAEAGLRAAERELDFLADTKQELEMARTMDATASSMTATALRDWEKRTGHAHLDKLERVEDKIADLDEQHEEEQDRVFNAAEEAQEAARLRLKKGLEKVKKNREKGVAVLAQENQARSQAVLELKASLAAVREDVAHKANLYRQLQKQKKEVQEKEFQDLLEQGLNPYEVYRKRDIEKQAARQRKAIRDNIEQRQVSIAEQLALEDVANAKTLAARELERGVLATFQREMGIAAQEQRTENFMLRNTKAHVNMLDPTGHLDPDPSAVTTFKTKDFGMGRADPKLVEMLTRHYPDVGPKELLMPNKYRTVPKIIRTFSSRKNYDDLSDDMDMAAAGDSPPSTPPEGAAGTAGWKVLETRQLTKFEQDAMDRAKERHQKAIGKAKTMMGREFSGDAFVSTPEVVVFKDFEVGQTYTQKVIITNRSYEKNTYRVLQIPPEHGNVLEVSYKLPGYIATGVSADLTISFSPKTNEDIATGLEMLADTGPFEVPIRCLTKKAAMVVSASNVDFGPGVTLAESASQTFTIANEGALDVEYTISADNEASDGPGPDGKLRCGPFTVHQATGSVVGYGKATVSCVFSPLAVGAERLPLLVTYKSTAQRRLFIPPGAVVLKGVGRDVPIFLENSVLDFKCSMVDHVYRDYLQVRNGGKTAMKLNVVNRPDVSDYFEFSPDLGFAQAGEAFPVTVLFKPRARMLEQCARFLVDPERAIFEIPMKLNVPDQRLPVSFTLRAQVTTTDLVFDPPSIDFGPCVMNENTAIKLRITNPSALPQTFGFTNLHQGINIKPNDGFGYVLPGETQERSVSFQPSIPGPQHLIITARTLAGRTFSLPCSAIGVQPDISLSHNRIRFPATPVKDITMVSLILSNNTEKNQAFEFSVPTSSDLTFIPNVGEIPPQSTFRVQVEFSPQPDAEPAAPQEEEELLPAEAQPGKTRPGSGSKKPLGKVQEAPEEAEEDAEEELAAEEPEEEDPNKWYRWRQWSVTCHIRPPSKSSRPGSASAMRLPSYQEGGAGEEGSPGRQLHLNVETCAVQPDIVLRTELPEILDKPMYELDFGPVPVGQRITRVIEVYNQGLDVAPLRCSPLDSAQVFGNVNAMRPLPAGGTFRVMLSFQPQLRTQYMEIMTLSSLRTRIRVALKGLGIAPELSIEPAEALSDGFNMGDVFRGESSERNFTVTNICPFPLTFSMLFRGVPDPNLQMKPAFYARPAEGTLAQGESAEVTLVFQPSNQRPYFEDIMQVYVPNQQEELLVPVKGRCWEEGVFVAGPTYPPAPEDPFMEKQLSLIAKSASGARQSGASGHMAGKAAAPAGAGAAGHGSAAVALAPRELVLEFPHAMYVNEVATTSFEVGNLKSAAVGGAAAEVIIDDLPAAAKEAGWSIDPVKIPLAIGDKKPVQVRYSAPAEVHAGMAAYFGHQEYIELKLGAVLKGGLPAPPSPEGRRVLLLFRVLLKPGTRPWGEDMPPSLSVAAANPATKTPPGKK